MISKTIVKEKADELKISFSNVLSAAVCEKIIEIISKSRYGEELFLSNSREFTDDIYRDICVDTIEYEFEIDLDEKMLVLYLRDIYKEIILKASYFAFKVSGLVEENEIRLQVIIDEMYVPIKLVFTKIVKDNVEESKSVVKYVLDDTYEIIFRENKKEGILAKNIVEIVEKLELINDMETYLNAYDILCKYSISGRKMSECLYELLSKKRIEIDDYRLDLLKSYGDSSYMKKKWKVLLRQKKKSEPTWTDLTNCLFSFLVPLLEAIKNKQIFLGDWMPQLKRYLD